MVDKIQSGSQVKKNNNESSLRAMVIQIEFHGNLAIFVNCQKHFTVFLLTTLGAVREVEETTTNYYMMSSSHFQTVCTVKGKTGAQSYFLSILSTEGTEV